MFIVVLRLSEHKSKAGELMEAHNSWIQQGFDEKVFLLAGSLNPKQGGVLLAHQCSMEALQQRVASDPFVENKVVSAEILSIAAAKTDPRLQFLLAS